MKIPEASDKKLLEQIVAGNIKALSQIVDRYQEMVLSLAFRNIQNWDDAEDIAQETFLRVYKSADQYQGRSSFKTWLFRIVVNLCMDHRRKKKPNISLETVATDLASESIPDSLETDEISAIVQRAVSNLPDRQRTALILHRYENLTHADISEVTGWSISAIESLLVRAYGNLRKTLGDLKK
jgi:RNA polymerase sigma-70 factor (ECF subfamily)